VTIATDSKRQNETNGASAAMTPRGNDPASPWGEGDRAQDGADDGRPEQDERRQVAEHLRHGVLGWRDRQAHHEREVSLLALVDDGELRDEDAEEDRKSSDCLFGGHSTATIVNGSQTP
jgi:hypothetical protein